MTTKGPKFGVHPKSREKQKSRKNARYFGHLLKKKNSDMGEGEELSICGTFGIIIALEYWQKKSKNALYYMRNLKKNKSTLEGGGRRVLEPLVPFGIKITLVDITGLFSEETKSIFGRLKKYTILWVRLGKRINFFYGRGEGSCAVVSPFGIKIPNDYRPKNRGKCSILWACFQKRTDFRGRGILSILCTCDKDDT